LVLGFAGGAIPAVRFNRLLLKNVDVVGVGWGAFLPSDPTLPEVTDRALAEMVATGHVRPVIGRVYGLEEAGRALLDLEQGRAAGKIVLEV
jgi:NADPH2:quinone reductase